MAVYSCWYIFRTMSALDSPCYLSRFSSHCLQPSACCLLSEFPIFLFCRQLSLRSVSFVPLNFLLAVPRLSSTYNTLFALCAPPSPLLVTYIMVPALLLSCSVCSFGPKESAQLAELPRQSKAQIFKLLNGTLIMRFVRVPARQVTHARTHTHTERCTHRQTHLSIPFALSSSTNSIIICADQFGCIIGIDRNMQNF